MFKLIMLHLILIFPSIQTQTPAPGVKAVVAMLDSLPTLDDLDDELRDPSGYRILADKIEGVMRELQPCPSATLLASLKSIADRAEAAYKVWKGSKTESSLFSRYVVPWKQLTGESRQDYIERVTFKCFKVFASEIWIDRFLFEAPTRFVRKTRFSYSPIALKSPKTKSYDVVDLAFPVVRSPKGSLTIDRVRLAFPSQNVPIWPPSEFRSYESHFKRRKRWW
jgi:hypothetical protein